MKQNTIFITALLLIAVLATSGHAAIFAGPNLNASLLYYEPVPASPGSLLDVYVQITNAGETANRVTVEFIDNAPFSVDNEQDRIKTIERIPGQESALLRYKVRVSQNAVPGTSYLKINYATQGSTSVQTALLPIDIYSNTVSLNIVNVTLRPEFLIPGSVGRISFDIHNAAPIKIRDGTVTLDLSSVDIAPVGSTNLQRFTDLQAGQISHFQFDLSPSPSMAPGVYKIPIMMNFSDQQGRSYSRSEYIGVRVGAKPAVSIVVDDSQLTSDATSGDVLIRVTNRGLGEIKFVNILLAPDDSYELASGSEERYVGNIDSDDYQTARVPVEAKADVVKIPVTVTYMDALNTPYEQSQVLTVPVKKAQGGGSGVAIAIGVVILLAIIAYFVFRKKR